MDFTASATEEKVNRLQGYGPNMYSRSRAYWDWLLGYENGYGVWLTLKEARHHEKAVPKGLTTGPGYGPPAKDTGLQQPPPPVAKGTKRTDTTLGSKWLWP